MSVIHTHTDQWFFPSLICQWCLQINTYIYFCPLKKCSIVRLQWQPCVTAEVVFQRYYCQGVSLPVNKRFVQPMGRVSSQCLHEKSLRFCEAGNGRAFLCVLWPMLQVYYYQRTETSPCITNIQQNVMATITENTNTKFIAGVEKCRSSGISNSTMPSRPLPGTGFHCLRGGNAVVLVYVRRQRSCSEVGCSEHLISASVLQKRRKLGQNLRK